MQSEIMANAFPAAIANEPPPCISSEDEDSEEFHGHGLKLDVPSGNFILAIVNCLAYCVF